MIVNEFTLEAYAPSKHILELLRCIEGLGFIAGGYARYLTGFWPDLVPSDIDVFSYEGTELALFNALGKNFEKMAGTAVLATTSFKVGPYFDIPIQFVHARSNKYHKTYGTAEEVIKRFDFTTNMFAVELLGSTETIRFTTGPTAAADTNSRTLRVNNVVHPMGFVMRIAKYAAKGYKVDWAVIGEAFLEWDRRPEAYKVDALTLARGGVSEDPNLAYDMMMGEAPVVERVPEREEYPVGSAGYMRGVANYGPQ